MTFTEDDRRGIGEIKRMLRDIEATQKRHSRRFDVQAETLDGLKEQIASLESQVEAQGNLLIRAVTLLVSMAEAAGVMVESADGE